MSEQKSRAFICPKCDCATVWVEYRGGMDELQCECLRCKYRWEEIPSDRPAAVLTGGPP